MTTTTNPPTTFDIALGIFELWAWDAAAWPQTGVTYGDDEYDEAIQFLIVGRSIMDETLTPCGLRAVRPASEWDDGCGWGEYCDNSQREVMADYARTGIVRRAIR